MRAPARPRATRAPRAVIMHGAVDVAARPDEADTLVQCALARDVLERAGYACEELGLGLDLSALRGLASGEVDLVFNLVESLDGRCALSHLPVAVLETLAVPFTGAGSGALFLSTDKVLTKSLLRGAGLPTPDWWRDGAAPEGDFPVIVKSVHEDASYGLDAGSVVPARRAAAELRSRRRRFGGEWFAERYVAGREFNLSLIEEEGGPRVLPVAEIVFQDYAPGEPHIVDYAAKWDSTSFGYSHTPRRFVDEGGAAGTRPRDAGAVAAPGRGDAALARHLRQLALDVWHLLGLSGYARVDFRVARADDGTELPYVLEVNANPCLAEDAGFAAAAARAGLDLPAVIERIVAAAAPARARAA